MLGTYFVFLPLHPAFLEFIMFLCPCRIVSVSMHFRLLQLHKRIHPLNVWIKPDRPHSFGPNAKIDGFLPF